MTPRCCACLTDRRPEIRVWGTVLWCRQCALEKGGPTGRRAVTLHDLGSDADAFTPAVLQAIANGPVMDSNVLFLPAGKISAAEAAARERAGMERLA